MKHFQTKSPKRRKSKSPGTHHLAVTTTDIPQWALQNSFHVCVVYVCVVFYDPIFPCPKHPSFSEPLWNFLQLGGAKGPSIWGFGPGQRHSWPQSQRGATSRPAQKGHFSFPRVQSVLQTESFSGLWDSTQLEKIIWGLPRKSDVKTAQTEVLFLSKIIMNYESWGNSWLLWKKKKSRGKVYPLMGPWKWFWKDHWVMGGTQQWVSLTSWCPPVGCSYKEIYDWRICVS